MLFNTHKVTAVPSSFAANDIFFVAPAANPNDLEIHLANSAGDALRKIYARSDAESDIAEAIASLNNGLVADTIAARDAIAAPKDAQTVLVIDATDDATVDAGAATYVYRASTAEWVKISEAESLDLEITWAAMTGKPNALPAAIDAAVAASHTHTNKTQLDKFGQDGNGNATYDGGVIKTEWLTTDW